MTETDINELDLDRYHEVLALPARVRERGVVAPVWRTDGSSFCYVDGAPDRTTILVVDPVANTVEPLVDVDRVRKALEAEVREPLPYAGLPFTEFRLADNDRTLCFRYGNGSYRLDIETYRLTAATMAELTDELRRKPRAVRPGFLAKDTPDLELPSPDGRWLLGERDHNLTLRAVADDRVVPLTSDGAEAFEWRVAGAKWSPHGLYIAAGKIDTRAMHRVPIVHWLKPVEEVEWAPFFKSGAPGPRYELHVVDVHGGDTVRVQIDDFRDGTLSVLGWRPDGRTLLFGTTSRDGKRLTLRRADATTGESAIIVDERAETFVVGIRPEQPIEVWAAPITSSDQVLWLSERDGWANLYLYDLDGTLVRQVTHGQDVVERVVCVDEAAGWVYYIAHPDRSRPYDQHLCRVRLDGTDQQQLTVDTGVRSILPSPSKQVFVEMHSTVDRPPRTDLRSADGALVRTLTELDTSILEAVDWRAPEEFRALAADGETELHGTLYLPPGFDPMRRYPVIDFIYGGPQTVQHPRDFSQLRGELAQALAQVGFVTFSVDARGTPERGKVFQDAFYGRWAETVIPDHVAVLDQLAAARPYIDADRAGIIGGSWGGYMTLRAMLTVPDRYRAGVSIYPVGDLYDHAASAIEPYMGLRTPETAAAYEAANLLPKAGNLRGKLLLVHGTSDVNATFSATMKIVDALVRAGRPHDQLVLPGLNHSLAGYSGRFLTEAAARYFVEHLQP